MSTPSSRDFPAPLVSFSLFYIFLGVCNPKQIFFKKKGKKIILARKMLQYSNLERKIDTKKLKTLTKKQNYTSPRLRPGGKIYEKSNSECYK
ncbi:MAG: hypothetical protein KAR13_05625, partial [Desulfobulbaceae bacterium]|nr:hypothetical protein [Desulfobulbaceae bacterium]